MKTLSAFLGVASFATAGIAAVAYIVVTGLRSMSQQGLLSRDRSLIGRYMLIGVLAMVATAIALAGMQYVIRENPALRCIAEVRPASGAVLHAPPVSQTLRPC